MVSVDLTLFIEIGIFLILLFILNRILYRPLLKHMNTRNQGIQKNQATADENTAEEKSLLAEIRHQLQLAGKTVEERTREVISFAEKHNREQNEILSRNISEKLSQKRESVADQAKKTQKELEPEVEQIAKLIVKKLLAVLLVTFLSATPMLPVGFISPANAEETEVVSEEQGHEEGGISETWRAINFLTMVGILTLLLRKPVTSALKDRIKNIEHSISDAKTRVQETEANVSETRIRRTQVTSEYDEILESGEARAETLKENLLLEGKQKATRLEQDAEHQIETIMRRAEQGINEKVVSLALQKVEEQLVVDKETDNRLVNDTLDKLDAHIAHLKG